MQTATILRRIEKLPALSRAGKRINGLHRLMRSRCLYERLMTGCPGIGVP